MALTPFHVALQVRDIDEAKQFYKEVLSCSEGRSTSRWVDFNLFGHQFVCHLNPALEKSNSSCVVDDHGVPVPHCGVVLEMHEWEKLAGRVKSHGVEFVVEPYIRFKGKPGEQATFFIFDPSGNALEFKAFRDIENQLFAT